jgi:peptidyl-prolyl cis-trans isomerase B (cyclophilin B)
MRHHRLAAALALALTLAACSSGAAATPSRMPSPALSAAASAGAVSPSDAPGASTAGSASLAGCPTSQPPAMAATDTRTVTITTAKGPIVIKVEGALSPIAAGNFVALAQCGYYDNVIFQRLVPGFVIQGGDGEYGREPNVDPARVGTGKLGYTLQDEPVSSAYTRGAVAMAKSQQPNSADSQFFIVLADAGLPPSYQIFGHVTSGMNAVDAIAAMPNSGDPRNQALDPVAMTKVTVSNP